MVAETTSGEESLAIAAEVRPDLVLMDVNLPGISGIDAARQLTAAPGGPVVVLLSTYDEDEFDLEGCGASAYVAKAAFGPTGSPRSGRPLERSAGAPAGPASAGMPEHQLVAGRVQGPAHGLGPVEDRLQVGLVVPGPAHVDHQVVLARARASMAVSVRELARRADAAGVHRRLHRGRRTADPARSGSRRSAPARPPRAR